MTLRTHCALLMLPRRWVRGVLEPPPSTGAGGRQSGALARQGGQTIQASGRDLDAAKSTADNGPGWCVWPRKRQGRFGSVTEQGVLCAPHRIEVTGQTGASPDALLLLQPIPTPRAESCREGGGVCVTLPPLALFVVLGVLSCLMACHPPLPIPPPRGGREEHAEGFEQHGDGALAALSPGGEDVRP
jgi:hypothetical protein